MKYAINLIGGVAIWAAALVAYFVAVVAVALAAGQVLRMIDEAVFQ
jgi:hypothetical protein